MTGFGGKKSIWGQKKFYLRADKCGYRSPSAGTSGLKSALQISCLWNMEYLKVLNDILILNEPETPLKCRKLVISGWDRFVSKWAEVLMTKLCREIDSAMFFKFYTKQ